MFLRPPVVTALVLMVSWGAPAVLAQGPAVPVSPVTPLAPNPALDQGLIRQAEELYSQGEFDAALAQLQELLKQQQGQIARQAETYNLIGLVHDRRRAFNESVAAYQKALELYQSLASQGDTTAARQGEAKTLNNLGTLYVSQERVPEALGFLERSLGLSRQLQARDNEAITLRNIASLYLQAERREEAIATYEASLKIERELKRTPQIVALLDRLSAVYLSVGSLSQALQATEAAYQLVEPTQDTESKLLLLDRLGSLYEELGQGTRSLQAYGSALALVQPTGDPILEGRLRNRLAGLYSALGEIDRALQEYEAVLAIAQSGQDRLSQARILTSMGDLHRRNRRWDAAKTTYRQALDLVEPLDNPLAKGQLLTSLAAIAQDQSQPAEALKLAQQAVAAQQATLKNPEEQASLNANQAASLRLLGDIHSYQGQYAPALEAYRRSLELLGQRGNPLVQSTVLSGLGIAFTRLGRSAEAIAPLEDAIRLGEALDLGAIAAREGDSLQTSYAALIEAQLAQGKPEAALVVLEQQRSRLLRSYRDQRQGEGASPPETLTLAQIQQQAKDRQATVVFYDRGGDRAANQLRIWLVQPSGTVVYKTVELPETFDTLLASGGGSDRLAALSQLLIAPIQASLPSAPESLLAVVPAVGMERIPFAALPLSVPPSGQAGPTAKLLLEQHTLITLPALQAIARPSVQRNSRENASALVVGDPQLPRMARRPAVAEELTAVAKLLKTQPIMGKDATLQAIAQSLSQARTLHFSLPHLALANGVEALAFASEDAIESITPLDLLRVELNADLVVINGLAFQTEPLAQTQMSLAQAFLTAGASVVVTSVGPGSEEATRELMTAFYSAIDQQVAPAAALRQAMLQVRQQHPDPSHWANFIVMGL